MGEIVEKKEKLAVFKIEKYPGNFTGITIKDETGYKACHFVEDPFCNCQVVAVCFFQGLVTSKPEEVLNAFYLAAGHLNKRQFLIDCYETHKNFIKNVFGNDEIMYMQPYRNGTGAQMMSTMVRLVRAAPNENDESYEPEYDSDYDYFEEDEY